MTILRREGRDWLVVGLVLIALVAVGALYWFNQQSEKESAENTSVAEEAKERAETAEDLAARVVEICQEGGKEARSLTERGLCPDAEAIVEQEPVPGPKGDTGPMGPRGPAATFPPNNVKHCPDGRYVSGIRINENGWLTINCKPLPTFPPGGN